MQFFKSYFSESNGKSKRGSMYPEANLENPQSLLDKERMSRTVHSQKVQFEDKPSTAVFEQFLVVGAKQAPPPGKTLEPELLFKYPPNSPPIPDVANFCFPSGVKLQQLKRTPSMSSLYELLCHQIDLSHSPSTFIFVLTTENREILYGACVRKDEAIEHLPSFVKKEEPKQDHPNSLDVSKSTPSPTPVKVSSTINIAPRCYLFITKYPFFHLHFEILHGILAMEHVHHITSPYLHPTSSSNSFGDNLDSEQSSLLAKNTPKLAKRSSPTEDREPPVLPSGDVLQILQKYRSMIIPNSGQTIEFRFPSSGTSSKIIQFARPIFDEEDEALKEWALPLALHTLSKKSLFTMFNACVLEKKVAFVSTNLRLLSAVVLAFIPLLRPFVYQSVCIPILPYKMISLLEAPVPFIVGISQIPEKWPSDVILLNLDDGNLYQSGPLPDFPKFKGFDTEFLSAYSELKKTWVKDEIPYIPTSKQLRLAKRISSIFTKSLISMFSTFKEHCITDMSQQNTPITVFIKESFLESVHPDDYNWYSTLVDTQIFFHYIDNRLRKMDRKPLAN